MLNGPFQNRQSFFVLNFCAKILPNLATLEDGSFPFIFSCHDNQSGQTSNELDSIDYMNLLDILRKNIYLRNKLGQLFMPLWLAYPCLPIFLSEVNKTDLYR